jgi:hypothetical protein
MGSMGILLTTLLLCLSGACAPETTAVMRAAESGQVTPAPRLQTDSPGEFGFWSTDPTNPFATSESLEDDETDERDDLDRIALLGRSRTQFVSVDPDGHSWTADAPPIVGAGRLFLVYQRFVC